MGIQSEHAPAAIRRRAGPGVAAGILGVALLALVPGAHAQPPLPRSVLGDPLVNPLSGPRAAETLARLHGREVSGGDDAIGHYGDGADHVMLYASRFASPEEARDRGRAMARRVAGSRTGFGHHRTFGVRGVAVHFVLGEGKAHYFYARNRDLYWLAVPVDRAPAALAEIVGAERLDVPSVVSLLGTAADGTPFPLERKGPAR